RDRVLEPALDEALERPRTVRRVVTLAGQQVDSRISDVQPQLALGEAIAQSAQLDRHDLAQLLLIKPGEQDDVVDSVEKLRPEVLSQLREHRFARLFPVRR